MVAAGGCLWRGGVMARHRLTAKKIAAHTSGRISDGDGLVLQAKAGSGGHINKNWVFRYTLPGSSPTDGLLKALRDQVAKLTAQIAILENGGALKRQAERYMGLGALRDVDVHAARAKAEQCRALLKAGFDPQDARNSKAREARLAKFKEKTFRQAGEEWYAENFKTWGAVRQNQIKRRLEMYVYPKMGDYPCQRLSTKTHDDAHVVIKGVLMQPVDGVPFWDKHPVQSGEILYDMHAILQRAWREGYLDKGDFLATDVKGKLGLVPHKSFHRPKSHPALHWKEAGQFMATLRARHQGRLISGLAMEFIILTGVRMGQVCTAVWSEISEADAFWECTNHKTFKQTGEPYEVFLSPQAMAIVEKMKAIRVNQFVFPGGHGKHHHGHITRSAIDCFMKDALGRRDITRHGMRTALRSYGESSVVQPPFSRLVLEKVLNHQQPGLGKVYGRNAEVESEVRRLMQMWADHCDSRKPYVAAGRDVKAANQ
jgi:integrase